MNNGTQNGIHPARTLLFLVGVMAMLLCLMAVFPEKGIRVTPSFTLNFPTVSEFFNTSEEEPKDISLVLGMTLDTTTNRMVDSTKLKKALNRKKAISDSIRLTLMHLQFPENDKGFLAPFFAKLDRAAAGKEHIRVLHFGDSQIEGDRISSYVRYHLQRKFGGSGPGLIPAMQPIPSMSVKQSASEGWKRYTKFGLRDSTVFHNRYGVMASFSRFLPVLPDTLPVPPELAEASITINRSTMSYANCRTFDYCKMYYSHNRDNVIAAMYADNVVVRTDTLRPSRKLQMIRYDFPKTPDEFTIRFAGRDSPDIYGLALDGNRGVSVDNIPMRGSAGTIFTSIDAAIMKAMLDDLNPQLIIMQFGGNVMPYMKTDKDAEQYGRSFRYQLQRLRKYVPGIAIIVIGPSDMSIKEKDKYVTYPWLEKVRDEMKKATFEEGCVYWDLYEVMGGKNSMPLWVNAEPSLAGKDYVHFSPKGARKVAELFFSALLREYETYKKGGQY